MLLTKRLAAGAFAGLLCASILAAPAAAQTTATASINARAQVSGIAPLTAAGVNDLDFGTVTAGTPFRQTDPTKEGRFSISGQASQPVTVSFTLPTVLTGSGSATIPITFGSSDGIVFSPSFPTVSTTFSPSAAFVTNLNGAGSLLIGITGTVSPPSLTTTGLYQGTVTLTVSY
jgi:spore coat protein U-like protein